MTITSAEGHRQPRADRPVAPSLRRTSALETGADLTIPAAQILAMAQKMAEDHHYNSTEGDTSRDLYRGAATRPDLTAEQVTFLAGRHDWGITARLMKNSKARNRKAVRDAFTPEVVWSLLDEPERFAKTIIAHIDGLTRGAQNDHARAMIATARQALGEDLLNRTIVEMINDPNWSYEAVTSSLFTDAGWDAAFAVLDVEKQSKTDRMTGVLGRIGGNLMRRTDCTDDRAHRLLTLAEGHEYERWVVSDFLRRPGGLVEDWNRLVMRKDRFEAEQALASDNCPDETRWHAARKHRPHGITKAKGPIPTDVALIVLDDIDKGRVWGRKIDDQFAARLRKHILRLTDDLVIWDRLLPAYLDQPGLHQDRDYSGDATQSGAALFYGHVTRNQFGDSGGKADQVLTYLSSHPDVRARAFTIHRIVHPDDMLAAAADPSPLVRQALASHPFLTGDARMRLALDEDMYVRIAVAERTDNWPDLLGDLSQDSQEAVRLAVAGHDLPDDLLDRLSADTATSVRLAIAGKSLPAHLLVQMSHDPDPDVRLALVTGQTLPLSVLQRMASDPDPRVTAVVAVKFLEAMQEDISDKDEDAS